MRPLETMIYITVTMTYYCAIPTIHNIYYYTVRIYIYIYIYIYIITSYYTELLLVLLLPLYCRVAKGAACPKSASPFGPARSGLPQREVHMQPAKFELYWAGIESHRAVVYSRLAVVYVAIQI